MVKEKGKNWWFLQLSFDRNSDSGGNWYKRLAEEKGIDCKVYSPNVIKKCLTSFLLAVGLVVLAGCGGSDASNNVSKSKIPGGDLFLPSGEAWVAQVSISRHDHARAPSGIIFEKDGNVVFLEHDYPCVWSIDKNRKGKWSIMKDSTAAKNQLHIEHESSVVYAHSEKWNSRSTYNVTENILTLETGIRYEYSMEQKFLRTKLSANQ